YRVDLTPFAGVLSNGEQHTVAVSVFNANGYFSATATLLLYLDDGSKEVTGAVTANTLASAPSPAIDENLQTDSSGDVTGSVSTTSARNFKISGYVKTSHGRVDTDVEQSVNFSNVQDFTINANQYVQDITQTTTVKLLTTARQGFAVSSAVETFDYPLTFNIVVNFNADGSATEAFTSGQQYLTNVLAPFDAGTVQNKVNSADTLNFDASGNFTGNTNTKSSQSYNSFDTAGGFYTCSLASASNALTSVSKGCPGESSK
ncbi:MAG TPA: peptide-N4-asparagine amidase, partial [Candidatus Acidoferrum sp.]|nr:peptide-N4-asparagine amidase [Candidatus Acidoferrum sp.]